MNIFHKKQDIEKQIGKAFRQRYRRKDVVLTDILLARPEDSHSKTEILPHLKYWHYRSDDFTDFFVQGIH